jgi:hypothetical protein
LGVAVIELPLSRGVTAFIDDVDQHLAAHKWFLSATGHVARSLPGGRTIYLAREIMAPALRTYPALRIGFFDRDPTNLTRGNLVLLFRPRRPDRGLYFGVRRRTYTGKWAAVCNARFLGEFDTAQAAAECYDRAAMMSGIRRRNF